MYSISIGQRSLISVVNVLKKSLFGGCNVSVSNLDSKKFGSRKKDTDSDDEEEPKKEKPKKVKKPKKAEKIEEEETECKKEIKMRFIQFMKPNDCRPRAGILKSKNAIVELNSGKDVDNTSPASLLSLLKSGELLDDDFLKSKMEESSICPSEVTILPPITGMDKIICVGLNYKSHCEEQKLKPPERPMFFSKYSSTIIGYREDILYPAITERLDWEVELAVVMGKTARNVCEDTAMKYVFGYCTAQDISARDWQKKWNGGQFLLGKSMDTFCPLGPMIVHKSAVEDPYNLSLKCWVNGELKQDGSTCDMIFKIEECIATLSQCFTLFPGDIILTGTPGGVGMARKPPEWLKVGDLLESEVEGLGKMANPIVCS